MDKKFKIEDLNIGNGEEVKTGDYILIHYEGKLENGDTFDSSYKRGVPFKTRIGVGDVIEGWDIGVPGMKIGGKRRLIIPSEWGYGQSGVPGVIPPDSTLIFDLELVDIL